MTVYSAGGPRMPEPEEELIFTEEVNSAFPDCHVLCL